MIPAPPVQTITVVNRAGIPPAQIARVERSVQHQVAIAGRWWNVPTIRFGASGWRVTVRKYRYDHTRLGDTHYVNARGVPFAVIDKMGRGGAYTWSTAFSHELLEMLVDPYISRYWHGRLVEVCDPVAQHDYRSMGVWIEDFALPRWYSPLRAGRLDYLHFLHPRPGGTAMRTTIPAIEPHRT